MIETGRPREPMLRIGLGKLRVPVLLSETSRTREPSELIETEMLRVPQPSNEPRYKREPFTTKQDTDNERTKP